MHDGHVEMRSTAAFAHKLPSASAHVQLRLLNIKGPDYALMKSESLRISLNMGPAFSAETSGVGGKGAISCQRNGLLITPPDLELSHRADVGRSTLRALKPARLAIFIVSRELVADCLHELGLRSRDVAVTYRAIDPGDVLLPLAQSLMADLMAGSPDGWRATESLAKTLVGRLLLRLRTPGEAPTARDAMAKVCRHIESRLHEPLGLQCLAEVAGISQYHFCRVFHQEVGKSPHQYVMAARIDAARRLLQDPGACGAAQKPSMLDIALACGFGSSSHFSTQFRKHTGRSPLAWRSARGGGDQPGPGIL
jgi:AraC-like DNA-binding protein